MSDIDENKQIKKAAAGNEEAFEALVLAYQTPVYNLCLRMTGNPDDAADVAQEAFLKAWRNLSSFQFESAFSTWLYRLTSNACLDFLRSKKRRAAVSLTADDDEAQMLDVPDPAPTPENLLLAQENSRAVAEAVSALEPEHRQVITLRVIQELSYAEIAEILGVKEGTVKSRLARAREHLRKKLLQTGNKEKTTSSNKQKGGRASAL